MTKEQEYMKEIARLKAEIAKKDAELRAKGIDPEEYIASRPMGKFISEENRNKEQPGD